MKIKQFALFLCPYFAVETKLKFWLRMGHWLYEHRAYKLSELIKGIVYYKFHCDISPMAKISKTVRFPHPIGIVIAGGCSVGENTVIFQNVTLGMKRNDPRGEYPQIKDNCKIYPNSCVIGGVIISNNTIIGAGSTVTHSTEEGTIWFGPAATRYK